MNLHSSDHYASRTGNDFEPLLTLIEAATLLRIHPDTLKKFAQREQVPGLKIGKYWRFRASELDAWVKARVISVRSQSHRVS